VIDLPFGGGKVPLQANYVVAQSEGELILKNYQDAFSGSESGQLRRAI